MESLLRWSIQNSAPEDATGTAPPQPPPRKNLDPAIIDHILGKPDAVVMREAMAVALDKSKDEDDRVAALDEFEMLIENIDNATGEFLLQFEPSIMLTQAYQTWPNWACGNLSMVF
jgi:hsp70-interacting protein